MTKIKVKKKAADWAAFIFFKAAQIWSTRPMRYSPVQADQKKPNWAATRPIWQHCVSVRERGKAGSGPNHLPPQETGTQNISKLKTLFLHLYCFTTYTFILSICPLYCLQYTEWFTTLRQPPVPPQFTPLVG